MRGSGVELIDRSLGGLEAGLPLVIAGPPGSGRTVLCLELAAAALARGEAVTYLGSEPPGMLLRQAASLGLDLEPALRSERFVLLEMAPGASAEARRHGAGALIEALRSEAPATQLWILDPITGLTQGILDEAPLGALVRHLLEDLAERDAQLVATAVDDELNEEPALERNLRNVCGAFIELARKDGRATLRVAKSRGGSPEDGELHYRIGPQGSEIVVGERRVGALRSERTKVLVIDESPEVREELSGWLSERWDVATAADGVSALSRVLSERPDVIVLDLHMSRVPGRELLHSMRQGGVLVPVLATSAPGARASDRVSALVLGATDVVEKPIDRFELMHRVEAMRRLPAAVAPTPDYKTQLLSPDQARHSRSVPSEVFEERLERAIHFGEECGIASSVAFIEAESEEDFDAFVSAADDVLRAEDAVLAIDERRAVLLLVTTDVCDSATAFGRLVSRYTSRIDRSEPALRWVAVAASEAWTEFAEGGWKPFYQRLRPWSAGARG